MPHLGFLCFCQARKCWCCSVEMREGRTRHAVCVACDVCVCGFKIHCSNAQSCCWVHRQQQLGVGTCSNSASGRGGPDHRWCSFSILNILQIYLISFSLRNISFLLITGLPLSRDVAQSDDDVSPKCSFKTKTETRIRSPGTTFQSRAS